VAKLTTPAMERLYKKKKYNTAGVSSPGKEAWKRLIRDKAAVAGLGIIAILLLVGLFAPLIAPYGYQVQDYTAILQPPSSRHIFGTDGTGRDIFSRCIYGARYSLPIGIMCVIVGLLVGGILGVLAAYWLRTPKLHEQGFSYYAHTVNPSSVKFCSCAWIGIRPVVNIDSGSMVEKSKNVGGLYLI